MHVVQYGNVSPKVSQIVNKSQQKKELCKIPHLRCVEFEEREFLHHYMYVQCGNQQQISISGRKEEMKAIKI